MSPKGNKTLNLKCPEKESGTPSLRHVRVITESNGTFIFITI